MDTSKTHNGLLRLGSDKQRKNVKKYTKKSFKAGNGLNAIVFTANLFGKHSFDSLILNWA